ncbi:MarR family EPS-associated transcriptional regulator [Limnobacter sp.]|jgi:MarR family transcriptional regulator, temperature-dependent positive regulator of motility|uniref:MarR family EPS-associated transcriptional regulator n=1 Tax=Limnobacter sp. TaxID=2003368 RepID=UPI00391BDD47
MSEKLKNQQEEVRFRVLRAIEDNPDITQRQLAEKLGVSLGQINYQLKALKEKGLLKLGNFIRSDNKLAYVHLLTPKGMTEKIKLTESFIARKRAEFYLIQEELARLESELAHTSATSDMEVTAEPQLREKRSK